MELDPHGAPARGLRRYVRLVEQELGLSGHGSCVHLDPPVSAYLALEGQLPGFEDRDVALIWDEEHGWAVAVESRCGEDLLVVSYLGGSVLPAPRVVARFAERLLAGDLPGQPEPPHLRLAGTEDDLSARLGDYAEPVEALAGVV
ncbi:DUF6292 family protein [Prauserella muralis]|uniref:Uncharacterized protein n=1 Tax=Prauserella muralis TaxID=588067 RepID=A0A2V4AHP8_9PSEU|nr:DUF6292 family protein [Prauserella muralis]PXY19399.1 hypothetical protein BAY60_32145 [Prauserella muralis]TWE29369.1 hypothetical protein FHX69_2053 [Prauserella muralis]